MLDNYEVRFVKYMEDTKSNCHYLIHKRTGMRVLFLENDDNNKVFSIGFRTKVHNSTGVAHILEHSVLCGSEKYPLKDPFIELAKGSLNTFLNAMTYPDKTLYPVASTNNADFRNLMSVYLDAVFKPNIYKYKEIFMQEGWHEVLNNSDDAITYSGVVYNEMKGAYSQAGEILSREIEKSIFNKHTYSYDSGGDPANIIDLSYEEFLDFHRKNYNPSNAYLYLYGDLDLEETLSFIDENYINGYDRVDGIESIDMPDAENIIKEVKTAYSVADDKNIDALSHLSYNVAVDIRHDKNLYQALDILSYVLVNAPGAPISKALYEAGIGEEISAVFETGYIKPLLKITASNTDIKRFDEFKSIIDEVLKKQLEGGIDKTALLGALNTQEFNFRESDFGVYPKGLLYYLTILDSWNYYDDEPTLYIEQLSMFDFLKKNIATGYFENVVKSCILENSHKTFVAIYPQLNLQEKIDNAIALRAADFKASLDENGIKALIAANKRLEEYQSSEDSVENINKIPLLKISDIKRETDFRDIKEEKIGQHLFLTYETDSNGIFYTKLIFEIDKDITFGYLPYLGILSNLYGMVDTEDYSYNELRNQINLYLGGLKVEAGLCKNGQDYDEYRIFLTLSIKGLFSNTSKALELARQVLFTSRLDDKARVKEILKETKTYLESSFIRSGSAYAVSLAKSIFNKAAQVDEAISGLTFYDELNIILNNYDDEYEKMITKVKALKNHIIAKSRLIINYTGDSHGKTLLVDKINMILDELPNGEELPSIDDRLKPLANNTAIIAPSSTVQYVARAGHSNIDRVKCNAAAKVVKVLLGYEYLWNEIRVKGGAYGCACNISKSGIVSFSSYRDPKLTETEEVFEKTGEYLQKLQLSDRDINKYIIGTMSGIDTPLGPALKGAHALSAYFHKVDSKEMQQIREQVLDTTLEDIHMVGAVIDDAMKHRYACTIGSKDKIMKCADRFETVRALTL